MDKMSEEVFVAMQRLIGDVCGVSAGDIQSDGELVSYGMDSVRVMDLLMAIEDEFGVEIEESDPALATIKTVADLVALVAARR
jgi:acyl carrier protein